MFLNFKLTKYVLEKSKQGISHLLLNFVFFKTNSLRWHSTKPSRRGCTNQDAGVRNSHWCSNFWTPRKSFIDFRRSINSLSSLLPSRFIAQIKLCRFYTRALPRDSCLSTMALMWWADFPQKSVLIHLKTS